MYPLFALGMAILTLMQLYLGAASSRMDGNWIGAGWAGLGFRISATGSGLTALLLFALGANQNSNEFHLLGAFTLAMVANAWGGLLIGVGLWLASDAIRNEADVWRRPRPPS